MRQYFFKSWDEGYTSLCKYLAIDEENVWLNRICLPSGQLLWGWIDDQRRNKKLLNPEQIAKLNAVGFPWSVYELHWYRMLHYCAEFFKLNRGKMMPRNYQCDGLNVGSWFYLQLQRDKRGLLKEWKSQALRRILERSLIKKVAV